MGTRDRGWENDPLVPIAGAWLSAALDVRGFTVRELARRVRPPVGDSRIHYIASGQTKRCRRSLRAAIARVLRLDARLLAGERPDLPGGWLRPGADFATTPRAYLAAYELLAAVAKRLEREPRLSEADAGRLNRLLLDLLDPRAWRDYALRWAPRQRRGVRPEELEVAGPALAAALSVILAPWLRGYPATLDLEALAAILPRGPRSAPQRPGSVRQPVTPPPRPRTSGATLTLDEAAARLNVPKAWIAEQLSPEELAYFEAGGRTSVADARDGLRKTRTVGRPRARARR